ncbi:MAG: aminotransferase class V-fold PLP-dependent enzyme [Geminicoccaceae bacterium]|nr:MAG: aminotransferase class V-fold PLP-dependent enzyme [Geminicoccaceae bacterium]
MNPLDVDRLRAETAGCNEVLHFNNAGAALPPDPVHHAVVAHLELERRIGGYEAKARADDALAGFYTSAAKLLNAHPDEIAFVENATRAWDMAFYAVPFQPGDRILTSEAEYSSNVLAFLQMQRRRGVGIDVVPSHPDGRLDVAALERMLDDRVKLVAVTHIPTYNGLIQDAAAIGAVTRRHGALYLLDACQSAGQVPLDVAAIGCDMLSATGRKYLRGPRGTGLLYVRRAVLDRLEPPFVDLHAAEWVAADRFELRPDAKRFENWEFYVAGKLGLKAAIDYALALGVDALEARIRDLADQLRHRLHDEPTIHLRDPEAATAGLVTFTKTDEAAEAVMARLRRASINVSVSSGAAHFDPHRRAFGAAVRASVHAYNTRAEIDRFVAALTAG